MNRFERLGFLAAITMAVAAPAPAQMFSDSYQFIKAVRDRKGEDVMKYVDKPSIIDTRDQTTGEAALHILVKRRDTDWLNFMLSKGAKPDVKDRDGNTPLGLAATVGYADGATLLIARRASVNLPNNSGETPLILAVQRRDLETVRVLLAAGADPKLQDRITGRSARDYAAQDARAATILKEIDGAKPVAAKKPMQGPKL